MNCPHCKAPAAPGTKFCEGCGRPIAAPAATTPPPAVDAARPLQATSARICPSCGRNHFILRIPGSVHEVLTGVIECRRCGTGFWPKPTIVNYAIMLAIAAVYPIYSIFVANGFYRTETATGVGLFGETSSFMGVFGTWMALFTILGLVQAGYRKGWRLKPALVLGALYVAYGTALMMALLAAALSSSPKAAEFFTTWLKWDPFVNLFFIAPLDTEGAGVKLFEWLVQLLVSNGKSPGWDKFVVFTLTSLTAAVMMARNWLVVYGFAFLLRSVCRKPEPGRFFQTSVANPRRVWPALVVVASFLILYVIGSRDWEWFPAKLLPMLKYVGLGARQLVSIGGYLKAANAAGAIRNALCLMGIGYMAYTYVHLLASRIARRAPETPTAATAIARYLLLGAFIEMVVMSTQRAFAGQGGACENCGASNISADPMVDTIGHGVAAGAVAGPLLMGTGIPGVQGEVPETDEREPQKAKRGKKAGTAPAEPPKDKAQEKLILEYQQAALEKVQNRSALWKAHDFLKSFVTGATKDAISLPGAMGQELDKAFVATKDALNDQTNWEAGDKAVSEFFTKDSLSYAAQSNLEGFESFGKAIGNAISTTYEKEGAWGVVSGFAGGLTKALLGVENWEKVVDGDVPLGERGFRALYGAVDTALTVTGVSDWLKGSGVAKDAGKIAKTVDDVADGAKVVDKGADVVKSGATVEKIADEAKVVDKAADAAKTGKAGATALVREERKAAWEAGKQAGNSKVDALEKALQGGTAEEIKAASLEVQGDKHALMEINRRGDTIKTAMNGEMKKIYDATDAGVKAEIAAKYGLDPKNVKIELPTNPSATIKVGADRDVTVKILQADGAWKDVPSKKLQEIYDKHFFEAAEGAKYMPGSNASGLAKKLDQLATDSWSAESYGKGKDLKTVLTKSADDFSDAQQIGKAVAFKGQERFAEADHLRKMGNVVEAEEQMGEGMRQMTKQYRNIVLGRAQALREAGTTVKIPQGLQKEVGILNKVEKGLMSPAEAEAALHKLGTTPDKVATRVGDLVEAMQKLKPKLPGRSLGLAEGVAIISTPPSSDG